MSRPASSRKKPLEIVAASPSAVCAMLGIRDADIRGAINSGALPVYVLGLRRRLVLADAIAWLRTHPQTKQRRGSNHG